MCREHVNWKDSLNNGQMRLADSEFFALPVSGGIGIFEFVVVDAICCMLFVTVSHLDMGMNAPCSTIDFNRNFLPFFDFCSSGHSGIGMQINNRLAFSICRKY